MTPTIDDAERRRRIGVRHRLTPERRAAPATEAAASIVALHSSDPATVYLSAMARMDEPSIAAVDAALYTDRDLVRHHAMRRTMWVMEPSVAREAHAATTRKIAARERKRLIKALATNADIRDPEQWFTSAAAEVVSLVASEPGLSTREVGSRLPHLVVPIDFGSAQHPTFLNAHTKVLQQAGLEAELVRGAPSGNWMSSEYSWSTADQWTPGGLDPDITDAEAAASLLGRWLDAFGPASEVDIAWWFAWTKTVTRKAIEASGAEPVRLESGADAWVSPDDVAATQQPPRWVALLPGLDGTTMGWKERGFYLPSEFTKRLFDRFGNAGPTIWADGEIVGGWTLDPHGKVVLDTLRDLDTAQRDLLFLEIERVETATGGRQVKPRFPSPNQKQLLG